MEGSVEMRTDYVAAPALVGGKSAASWPAIIAGAFVAAAVSLVLLALGSGLGFASVSPWPGRGISVTTFAVTTAIWLIVMQWVSSGVGGYIAGRLRTRWIGTHAHEVFFRDTAHGFVTWAVATVLVAAVFATSASSAIGGATRVASSMSAAAMQGPAQGAGVSPANAYGLDKLLRATASDTTLSTGADLRAEALHIVANGVTTGTVPDSDRHYLADLVAARAGRAAGGRAATGG